MNDHIKSEITVYLAGGLTESRSRQIEAHAVACEKCQAALNKARAKQARSNREALKKASPERIPNLFLARQGKSFMNSPATSGRWKLVVFLVALVGLAYWGYARRAQTHRKSAPSDLSLKQQPSEPVLEKSEPVPPEPTAPKSEASSTAKAVPAVKPPEPPKPPLTLPVLQSLKGTDSGIQEPRVVVVRRLDAWEQLWGEMGLQGPRPAIDFNTKLLLGIFAGASPPGASIDLGVIEEMEGAMSAPYRILAPPVPAPATTTQISTTPMSHPYFLAIVPRVDQKIRIYRKERP